MKRMAVFRITVGLFFALEIVCCKANQSLKSLRRGPGGEGHAIFRKHPFSKLNVTPTFAQAVKTYKECLRDCAANKKCWSANFGTKEVLKGVFLCELLPKDRYNASSSFVSPVQDFVHYSIKTPCLDYPCQHGGSCTANYFEDTYKCMCKPGFKGRNCDIQTDFRSCAQRFAAGYTNSGIYEIITPDKSKIDVFCDHGNGQGWTMIFKAVSGVPLQQGPAALWLSNSLLESSPSALPVNSSSRQHYKNRIIEYWQAFNPTQVRLSLYKSKAEVVRLVFNATGSDKTNWFSSDRLLTSPWTDIHSKPVNIFLITGDDRPSVLRRKFLINSEYGECAIDLGWMVLLELNQRGCPWEYHTQYSVLYSPSSTRVRWQNQDAVSIADMMAIYIR